MKLLVLLLSGGSAIFVVGCSSLGTAAPRTNQGGATDLYGDFRPASIPPATGRSAPGGVTTSGRPSVGTGVVVGGPPR